MEVPKVGNKYKVTKLLDREGKPILNSPYIGRVVTIVRILDNAFPYLCDDGKIYLAEELEPILSETTPL